MTGNTPAVAWLPAIAGTATTLGAIALLMTDAWEAGQLTTAHVLQPLLVIGSIAAAVMAHHSGWRRPVRLLLFSLLAVFGSGVILFQTLGRQADARDAKLSEALATNRQLLLVEQSLSAAKADAKRECASGFGQRCIAAQARVDQLTNEMASQRTIATDARADAIADLLHLIAGTDKAQVRAMVQVLDPILLPGFLELSSVVFFAYAFPRRRPQLSAIAVTPPAIVVQSFTRAEALRDLLRNGAASGQELAQRWGVHPSTACRWLQSWEGEGRVARKREGRTVLALPRPR